MVTQWEVLEVINKTNAWIDSEYLQKHFNYKKERINTLLKKLDKFNLVYSKHTRTGARKSYYCSKL